MQGAHHAAASHADVTSVTYLLRVVLLVLALLSALAVRVVLLSFHISARPMQEGVGVVDARPPWAGCLHSPLRDVMQSCQGLRVTGRCPWAQKQRSMDVRAAFMQAFCLSLGLKCPALHVLSMDAHTRQQHHTETLQQSRTCLPSFSTSLGSVFSSS